MFVQDSGGSSFVMHTAAQCTTILFDTASAGLESKAINIARSVVLSYFETILLIILLL